MFGIDATVDGMKYATIAAAPVFGASVARMDDTAARAMPGVIDVNLQPNSLPRHADAPRQPEAHRPWAYISPWATVRRSRSVT